MERRQLPPTCSLRRAGPGAWMALAGAASTRGRSSPSEEPALPAPPSRGVQGNSEQKGDFLSRPVCLFTFACIYLRFICLHSRGFTWIDLHLHGSWVPSARPSVFLTPCPSLGLAPLAPSQACVFARGLSLIPAPKGQRRAFVTVGSIIGLGLPQCMEDTRVPTCPASCDRQADSGPGRGEKE